MSVTFLVERFEGPLDLLLQLVEKNELDISTISLASVADQFLHYLHSQPQMPLEEVADFLVLAAKLLFLKSRLLLPSLDEADLEDGQNLAEQLRRYRSFVTASKKIQALWHATYLSFPREPHPARHQTKLNFAPPPGITVAALAESMRHSLARLEPAIALSHGSIERTMTIQEKISALLEHVKQLTRTTFSAFIGRRTSKAETVVSFLALLELVKQRFIRASQPHLFQAISIECTPDALTTRDPLDHSFIYAT